MQGPVHTGPKERQYLGPRKEIGLNAFLLKKDILQGGYLQAEKDQVIRHNDALAGPGGSPGTFQNST